VNDGRRPGCRQVGPARILVGIILVAVGAPSGRLARAQTPPLARGGGTSAARSDVKVQRLVRQVMELAKLSTLDGEKAAAILGSKMGPLQNSAEEYKGWPLAPTDLIEEGVFSWQPKELSVQVKPDQSLQFGFEDLADAMLDFPGFWRPIQAHVSDPDSTGILIVAYRYVFDVPAGSLIVIVPTSVKEQPDQMRKAGDEAHAILRGKAKSRGPIDRITISNVREPDVFEPRTLRQWRAPKRKAPAH
jgi:hypothetical protein